MILIGIYLVLQFAGLTRLALTVLSGTGLVGIVLGLAFREIAENSLASIRLSVRNPFRAGDWIEVDAHQGIVQNLNMRTTVLLTLDGNHVQIANALVFKSVIKNFSTNPNRRAEFDVGIGYDDSVLAAQKVIIDALRAHPAVQNDPELNALVDELGSSTVTIRVQFWFDGRSYSIFKVRSALMRQIKRALQDAGISMPDEAREIIFPDGVPIRRLAPKQPQTRTRGKDPDQDTGDSAVATVGEGDLLSEKEDLDRQADAADQSDTIENLLAARRAENDLKAASVTVAGPVCPKTRRSARSRNAQPRTSFTRQAVCPIGGLSPMPSVVSANVSPAIGRSPRTIMLTPSEPGIFPANWSK